MASHDSVLDDLGLRIAGGRLAPGTVLTLAGLEEHYKVSRTVVREAIRVLESKLMVESKRRIGITVTEMRRWSVLDPGLVSWRLRSEAATQQLISLMELRLAVEPAAAKFAALRASEDQRAEINRQANVLLRLGEQGAGDSEEYLLADIAFHDCLLDSSGNLMLAAIKEPIAEFLRGRQSAGLTPQHPAEKALRSHVETAAAIVRGDSESAEQYVRGYVETVLAEVRSPNTGTSASF